MWAGSLNCQLVLNTLSQIGNVKDSYLLTNTTTSLCCSFSEAMLVAMAPEDEIRRCGKIAEWGRTAAKNVILDSVLT